jgi:hypothetical protein
LAPILRDFIRYRLFPAQSWPEFPANGRRNYFYILLIKSKPYLGEKLISAQVISLQS